MKSLKFLFVIFTSFLFSFSIFACTGIQIKTKEGAFVNGRTVEFGIPLNIAGLIIPRNYQFKGTLPNGSTGMVYRSKYAAIGANTFGMPAIIDGINEKGLSAGAFYFPGYASYTTITSENKKMALAPTEFVNWILTQFENVDEVKKHIKSVVIAPTGQVQWGGIPPFHYIVYDKRGKSIVIEPINGQLVVWDNPTGAMSNSPTFDWHLTNLSNYINLSPMNAPTKTIDGVKLQQLGQGTGLRGMPGDFTPPSRFVRAVIYSSSTLPAKNSDAAVLNAFHILNQFDIPIGTVRSQNDIDEYTLATTVKDQQNLKYYFRTYEDQSIKSINLNEFDLNSKDLHTVNMQGVQPVTDLSKNAKIEVDRS